MNTTKKTLLVIGGIFALAGIMRAAQLSDQNGQNTAPVKPLTKADKTAICKAYIGSIFGKPAAAISTHELTRETKIAGYVYVYYFSPERGEDSVYLCDVSKRSIAWKGWLNDVGEWGRWRQEDRSTLIHRTELNAVSFKQPDTGELITVQR